MLTIMVAVLSIVKMDRVVTSTFAQIIPTSAEQVTVYQALDPSIIRSLNVTWGQLVKAGELMATLDPTFATADVTQLKEQIASYVAQIARDEAQINRRPLVFPDRSDPDFLKYAAIQRALYDQQMAQYQAQIENYDAQMRQYNATTKKFQVDAKGYKDRQDIASRIENMRTVLAKDGYGSQLNMWQQQDQRVEMDRQVAYDLNSLAEAEQTLAAVTATREAYIQQWLAALSQDLLTVRGNLDTANAALEKALRHQDLVKVAAVEDIIVVSVDKSVGAVLKEGDQIFSSVPAKAPVQSEAYIQPRDIGFVRLGDKCVLKIDAFDFVEHGWAEGKVTWISEGTFTTNASGQPTVPYYKVRCSVDEYLFRNVPPNMRLIPGMTLESDLKVGTRSVAMYLLSGILRGWSESMREPE
jgi:HlyD family secretion protein